MDPAVPWQYTYNRLAAQGATSGDLHHHFTQAANNSALTSGHTSSQPLLGTSSAPFATPSSFLSAPSYDAVFSPLFHHANPKPAHFNTINAAAQHRQQVLAAQAAVTKQNSDPDVIRENYTQHHTALSTPQSGSYFDQTSGSAVASQLSAALGWQGRGQTDFSSLRSQSDLPSNNQLPSAFGILPHENVSSSPGPSATAKSSSSSYESFNAHFPQPLNQANAIIKSSSTARSMSPQQQIKQQTVATTSAPSSAYYQPEQLQHQSHSNYSNSSNQAISGSKSSFSSSTGISSSSQINSSSTIPINKEFPNLSIHHLTSRVKSERCSSPASMAQNYGGTISSSTLHINNNNNKLNSLNHIQTKAQLKALPPLMNVSQGQASSAIDETNVIQSSPISFSMLDSHQMSFSGSNNSSSHSASNINRNASIAPSSSSPSSVCLQHDIASISSASSNDNQNNQKHQMLFSKNGAFEMYNSDLNSVNSINSGSYKSAQSPIDVSLARSSSAASASSTKSNHVAYSSVIQRAAVPSTATQYWDNNSNSPVGPLHASSQSNVTANKYPSTIYNHTPAAQITKLHQLSPIQRGATDSQTNFNSYENGQMAPSSNQDNLAAQKIIESVQQIQSQANTQLALNQQRQRQCSIDTSEQPNHAKVQIIHKPKPGQKRKANGDKTNTEKLIPLNSNYNNNYEYEINARAPPPAHVSNHVHINPNTSNHHNHSHNSNNIALNNHNNSINDNNHLGNNPNNNHISSLNQLNQASSSSTSAMISHPSSYASHPYFPAFAMPYGLSDYSNDLNVNSSTMIATNPYNDSLGTPSVSSNYSPTTSDIREDEPIKVLVPNIVEELGFLTENNRGGGSSGTSAGNMQQSPISAHHPNQSQSHQPNLTLLGSASNALSQHSHQTGHSHQASVQQSSSQNQHTSAAQTTATSQQTNKNSLTDKKFATPTGPGSGFMQSYLKFLQGDRDASPPPTNRGNSGARKTWSRANSTNQSTIGNQSKNQTNNGMQTIQDNKALDTTKNRNFYQANDAGNNMVATSPYDRKRRPTYESDDSTNNLNNKQATNRPQQPQQTQEVVERAPQVPISQAAKKPRIAQSSHNNPANLTPQQLQTVLSSAQPINNSPQNQQMLMQQHPNQTAAHQLVAGSSQILHQQQMYYEQEVPQRRKTSHRKAKVSSNSSIKYNDFDDTELNESDSDPAWTPDKDDDDFIDVPRRKTRKSRTNNKQTKRNTTQDNNSVTNSYNDDDSKRTGPSSSSVTVTPQPIVGSSTSAESQAPDQQNEFQSGNFIICRQDVLQEWPAIWRVDGKTLLQKFEPFQNNGKMIYRSISTYATWSPESRRLYLLAKCKYIGQFQHEMHVELQRNELCSDTADLYIEKVLQDTMVHQDQFEVYIQTLISQALDSNFLMEIMQEQDDYFLSNVKAIDKITTERKEKLQMTIQWPKRMLFSIETWPCYNVITDLGVTNNGQIICAGCNTSAIVSRIILYGQPYNVSTIAPIQVDDRASFEKDFMLCHNCTARCGLYHKISHQKYLMFIECSRKVSQKNEQDPTKGSTAILNELLADETWLAQLFKRTRCVWAEIDQIYRLHKSSN